VRRILAISLLLLFGLPLVSPLFALPSSNDSNLPACCRRNGKHHCMMQMGQAQILAQGVQFNVVPTKCPLYPRAIPTAQHHELSLHAASLTFAEIISHPALHPQTEARARVSLFCARQKRGPPSLLS